MYRGLSYSSYSRQLDCQLGTTSKQYCFTCTHDSILPMSNISCPLGPCVPAVKTCLGCPSPHPPDLPQHLPPAPQTTQGILPSPHGPCVTLALPLNSPV